MNKFDLQEKIMNEITKASLDGALTREAVKYMDDLIESHQQLYVEIQEAYHDLVTFGTAALFITESDGLPTFRALHPSEYAIWTDSGGRVTKLVRDIRMTIREAIVEFGLENLAPDTIRLVTEGGDVDQIMVFTTSAVMIPKVVVDFAQGTATALFEILQRTNFSNEVRQLQGKVDALGSAKKDLEDQLLLLKGKDSKMAAREMAVVEREKKMTELELSAKWNELRVVDHKEMVALIFRATKRQIFENSSVPVRDQYGSIFSHPSSKEITEIEE